MSEKWQINRFSICTIEDESARVTICHVSLNGTHGIEEELNRRANLIAAAPEMLAELKKSRIDLAYAMENAEAVDRFPSKWLADLDRVIALAEGDEK